MTKFIKQTDTSDCYNACLASLTGIPIEAFPVWTMEDNCSVEQWNKCEAVLVEHAWTGFQIWPPRVPAGLAVAHGPSPRGPWSHSVIVNNGRPVFDPHPSNDFLGEHEPLSYIVLIRLINTEREHEIY